MRLNLFSQAERERRVLLYFQIPKEHIHTNGNGPQGMLPNPGKQLDIYMANAQFLAMFDVLS